MSTLRHSKRGVQTTLILWCLGLAGLCSPSLFAYSVPFLFSEHPILVGGAGGRWFTGSPRDGFTCDVCHLGGETFVLQTNGLPTSGYEADKKYRFEVELPKDAEHLAIIGEIVDASGSAAGSISGEFEVEVSSEEESEEKPELEAIDLEIFEVAESRLIFALGDYEAKSLTIDWRASQDSNGPVWLYMMGVIGDGSQDVEGDKVTRLVVRIDSREGPNGDNLENQNSGFCSIHPISNNSFPLSRLIVYLGIVGLMLNKRNVFNHHLRFAFRSFTPFDRSKFGLFCFIAIVIFGNLACANVKPYERGRLAQPDMKMDGNADLLSGQRHATDYREGSSGGYGGGGGGCGCN